MANLVLTNIKSLCGILENQELLLSGAQMSSLNCIENAYLVIQDGLHYKILDQCLDLFQKVGLTQASKI